jgi:hypothetical protein
MTDKEQTDRLAKGQPVRENTNNLTEQTASKPRRGLKAYVKVTGETSEEIWTKIKELIGQAEKVKNEQNGIWPLAVGITNSGSIGIVFDDENT